MYYIYIVKFKEYYCYQVMDDRWEKEVTEFGAINVTGFRIVDFSRKTVRDFINVWKREFGTDTISVSYTLRFMNKHMCFILYKNFKHK